MEWRLDYLHTSPIRDRVEAMDEKTVAIMQDKPWFNPKSSHFIDAFRAI